MQRLILTAALALGTALPAAANDQLARSLGVEPGAYTTSELARLKTATEENDHQRIDLITGGGSDVVSTQSVGVGAGQAQLARSLDVEPGAYSLAELAQLKTAMEENDEQRIDFITDGGGDVVSTQSVRVRYGQDQIAASLGVDAEDYTAAELARMFFDAYD